MLAYDSIFSFIFGNCIIDQFQLNKTIEANWHLMMMFFCPPFLLLLSKFFFKFLPLNLCMIPNNIAITEFFVLNEQFSSLYEDILNYNTFCRKIITCYSLTSLIILEILVKTIKFYYKLEKC